MKTRLVILMMVVAASVMLASLLGAWAQTGSANAAVPKYDAKAESTFKGTVVEVRERQCPVSGSLGSHIVIKMADGKTIEAHLATAKFTHQYGLIFHTGDQVEIIGSKVMFEGVETIFAREVDRGQESFMFRDKKGVPIW
jgi:hypothetical protein